MSALDRLWRELQHAEAWSRKFQSRPATDPVRAKWDEAARMARLAFEDEQQRLLDPESRLHP